MALLSCFDELFLSTVQSWLNENKEVFILVRYSRAGGIKDFEFASSFEKFLASLRVLPPQTSIVAYGNPQLPLRGIVDDELIAGCLRSIPDSAEYLVMETGAGASRRDWAAGESHDELRSDLEALRGKSIAAGIYPPGREKDPYVVSGIVPDRDGVVKRGVY
jgi:hypothetical protein